MAKNPKGEKNLKVIFVSFVRSIFYIFFIIIFVWVGAHLFFEKQVGKLIEKVEGLFYEEVDTGLKVNDLRVIFPIEPDRLEPTLADPFSRQRLVNIFEPLVKADRNLEMRPSLAISWGMIDDLTWEFRLRPGVKFHDSSSLDVNDVIASINRASKFEGSELKELIDFTDKIETIDDLTLRIVTKEPEPLLLQKLSRILIVPSEIADVPEIAPIGTGSYVFDSRETGEKMVFKSFDKYWGPKAKFDKVELFTRVDKLDRVKMFVSGEADVLSFVPFDAVSLIQERGFEILTVPTLEVQFLLFNFESEFLSDRFNREVVSYAIGQKELIDLVGGFAEPVSQYISNGVFGFNPNIENHIFDVNEAAAIAQKTGLRGKTLTFYLQKNLEVLGEYVKQKLLDIGVFVAVSYLDERELLESFSKNEADIYFLAFKSELGDSSAFLDSITHSNGDFNIINYGNEKVDELVDDALTNLDPESRLKSLQEAMRIVTEKDIVGVPLFEYDMVCSFASGFSMEPRIDGLIYFDEININ